MTAVFITDHQPVIRDGVLISGQFRLSNGYRGGYLTAKDGEISLHLEKPEGGFVAEAQGFYRTNDPIAAIRVCCSVLGWTLDVPGSTAGLIELSNSVLDQVEKAGIERLSQCRGDLFTGRVGRCLTGEGTYAGFGSGKCEWEVVIDHPAGVSIISRSYADGRRIHRWGNGCDENVGRDRAGAVLANFYCGGAK